MLLSYFHWHTTYRTGIVRSRDINLFVTYVIVPLFLSYTDKLHFVLLPNKLKIQSLVTVDYTSEIVTVYRN